MRASKTVTGVLSLLLSGVLLVSILGGGDLLITHLIDQEQVAQYVIQYINEERISRGFPSLGNDSLLRYIACDWSNYFAENNEVAHGDFQSRVRSINYQSYSCGEIICKYPRGFLDFSASDVAKGLVESWLDSPSHRQIMLSEKGGFMGVGVSKRGVYFFGVVDFRFS